MSDEYYAGRGCECFAWSEGECCCEVDWTDPEIYVLRERIKVLEIENAVVMRDAESMYERLKEALCQSG